MNIKHLLPALALVPLLVAGCGGSDDEAAAEGGQVGEGPVEQGDVAELGAKLADAWRVDCGEPTVDLAGYPKVTCPVPDDMMTPGLDENAVSVQSFTEWDQAEDFKSNYVGDEDGFVLRNGWFVNGPTQDLAEAAAEAIEQ